MISIYATQDQGGLRLKRETTEVLNQRISDRSKFDAGFGSCVTYEEGLSSYNYCTHDYI